MSQFITPQPNQYLTPFQKWQFETKGNVVFESGEYHHMVDDELENDVKTNEDFSKWMDDQHFLSHTEQSF